MKKQLIFFLCVLGLLQACSATTYQRSIEVGDNGYSDTQLAKNMFKVYFAGNFVTDKEQVIDYVLLRSADLATKHGFKYFVVVNNKNAATANESAIQIGVIDDSQDISGMSPRLSTTIICYKEKPNKEFVYDAKFISTSIRKKYGIEKGSDAVSPDAKKSAVEPEK